MGKSEPFYVAIITPVIHYCMGGLEIDVNSLVVNAEGKAIKGLYAAGEVAGGIHGNNRLGGNSLLDCVVFGRVAGRHAAKYMLGDNVKPIDLKKLSGANEKPTAPAPAAATATATSSLTQPLLSNARDLENSVAAQPSSNAPLAHVLWRSCLALRCPDWQFHWKSLDGLTKGI